MDIYIDGNGYGLEIPALTAVAGQHENFWKVVEQNRNLIGKIAKFLEENGAVPVLDNTYMLGIITNRRNPQPGEPVGITFYGSDKLAQAVADAFPAYKVMAQLDGKVFKPVQSAAPKPPKPKSGPRQKF